MRVVEDRRQRDARDDRLAVGGEHRGESQRQREQARVLDRGVGEQPLGVRLDRGVERAGERRDDTPSAISTVPQCSGGAPGICHAKRSMPYSPAFTMTPESIAETGAGASGCAIGSHTCAGTRPSLTANPMVKSQASRADSAGGSEAHAAASASYWNEPACAASIRSGSATNAAPICESAR